jgi:hypothetical protein
MRFSFFIACFKFIGVVKCNGTVGALRLCADLLFVKNISGAGASEGDFNESCYFSRWIRDKNFRGEPP